MSLLKEVPLRVIDQNLFWLSSSEAQIAKEIRELAFTAEQSSPLSYFTIRFLEGYNWLIQCFNDLTDSEIDTELLPWVAWAKNVLKEQGGKLPLIDEALLSEHRADWERAVNISLALMLSGARERQTEEGFKNESAAIGIASAPTIPLARLAGVLGHMIERFIYQLYPELSKVSIGQPTNKDNFLHVMNEIVKLVEVGALPNKNRQLVNAFLLPQDRGGTGWVSPRRMDEFRRKYQNPEA